MQTISDFICDSGSGRGNITVSTSVYNLEVIRSASYQFTGSYHVLITPNTDNSVTVIFEAKDKAKDVSEDLKDFVNTLIDHQVRLQLDKADGKIRDLIVAHAFSPLDLNKEIGSL
ncbi:MAG: His-Xaa-Ser system protein HxsD [Deltaproteobacteria bacterium]|nr:His-Xaa-Ser system protein HxsD [Deltaproteobacteria bacterium]